MNTTKTTTHNAPCAACTHYDSQTQRCHNSQLPDSIFKVCGDNITALQLVLSRCTQDIFRAGAAPSVAAVIVTEQAGVCAVERRNSPCNALTTARQGIDHIAPRQGENSCV